MYPIFYLLKGTIYHTQGIILTFPKADGSKSGSQRVHHGVVRRLPLGGFRVQGLGLRA